MTVFRPHSLPMVLLVFALAAVSAPSLAQEHGEFEVSGGVTVVGNTDIVDGYGPGWVVGGGWHATSWFAVEVEVDRSRHTQDRRLLAVDASVLGTLAGARVSMPAGPIRPVARLLAGQTQIALNVRSTFPVASTADFFERHGAVQLGGGADVPVGHRVSVRITFDYRRIFAPNPFWQRRFTTAAIYRFGGH